MGSQVAVLPGQTAVANPLLGTRLRSPSLTDIVFETRLNASWPAFLSHHRIFESVILPSPAYIEMALAAAEEVWGERPYQLHNFTIHEAIILPEEGWQTTQIVLSSAEGQEAGFQIVTLTGD
jgi:acyl transferase domain-containing protein